MAIKVGCSSNWEERIKAAISYSVNGDAGLIGVWRFDNYQEMEKLAHHKLREFRTGRVEMFEVDSRVVSTVLHGIFGEPSEVIGINWGPGGTGSFTQYVRHIREEIIYAENICHFGYREHRSRSTFMRQLYRLTYESRKLFTLDDASSSDDLLDVRSLKRRYGELVGKLRKDLKDIDAIARWIVHHEEQNSLECLERFEFQQHMESVFDRYERWYNRTKVRIARRLINSVKKEGYFSRNIQTRLYMRKNKLLPYT
jgi:hypothetical protein